MTSVTVSSRNLQGDDGWDRTRTRAREAQGYQSRPFDRWVGSQFRNGHVFRPVMPDGRISQAWDFRWPLDLILMLGEQICHLRYL
jgi:hypothetical protein